MATPENKLAFDSGWSYAAPEAGTKPVSAVPPTARFENITWKVSLVHQSNLGKDVPKPERFERIIWKTDAKMIFSSRTITLQMRTKPAL